MKMDFLNSDKIRYQQISLFQIAWIKNNNLNT